MKPLIIATFFLFLFSSLAKANEPDSAYIFSYTTGKHNNTAGLHYAWSVDKENWHTIGPEFRFLFSDFGSWGTQKKLINPFLFQGEDGLWHCLWTLNKEVGQFAHAATSDLYNWKRQSYPEVLENGNVINIEVSYDTSEKKYCITWLSEQDGQTEFYQTTTTDFKNYSPAEKTERITRLNLRNTVVINGEKQSGVINKVSWDIIDGLQKWYEWSRFHEQERADNM